MRRGLSVAGRRPERALAVRQTSGRERLNIHGALDLETGKTAMIEVESVDAVSTVNLLEAIEAMYPALATFAEAVLWFLRDKVPRCWNHLFRDSVTDNFRLINPTDFRVMA